MDEMNACSCCLRCPPDRDLTTPYTQLDRTEIYSDMLKNCFNIQPVLDGWSSRGICCTCAGRLRDASDFKLQVQRCQAELLARSHASRVKEEDPAMELEEDEEETAYERMLKRLMLVSEIAVRDGASDAGPAMLQEPVVKSEMEDGGSSDEIVLHEEISIKPEVIGEDEACDDDRQEMSLVVNRSDEYKAHVAASPCEAPRSWRVACDLRAWDHTYADTGSEEEVAISRCAGAESAASSRAVRPERGLRRTASEEEPYGCDMCPLRFSAKSSLTRHIGTHYQCELCNMTFMMSTCLIRHKRQCTENERYKCDTLLSEPSTLQINHGGQLLYSCDECGKNFRIKSALREHIQSHTVIGLNRTSGSCSDSGKHPNNKFCILELQSDERIHTGEMPFKCRFCEYKCSQKSKLQRHHMIHTGEKPYECRYCDYKCSQKSNLQKHQLKHTGEKPYECRYCNYKCSRKSYLQTHHMKHTGEKPHECRYCDYKCSQKSDLKKHLMIHTGEMPFKCRFCDYKCSRKPNLQMHQMIHTGERPHECRYCDYKCRRKVDLRTHQMIHTDEKPFKCRYCDYKCRRKVVLRTHQMIHTGEKPHECRYCDYKCIQKSDLKKHQMTHTGEKPFKCRYCDYKCRRKVDLRTHQMIHTGEKPHECRYCDYKCIQKSDLKKHQMTHTGEKPFKCRYCDYKCSQKSDLKRHQMIHTGEKPFKCRYCDYKCSQKSHLQTHQMKHRRKAV